MGAVEPGERMAVHREVRWHPVDDDADAALVHPVDHPHQVGRGAVAGGRGEVPRGLVAPRSVERVLHDRQQLDVRESVRQRVVGERVGELVVARPATAGDDRAAPGTEVHLVDRDRGGRRESPGAARVIQSPSPQSYGEVGDHRRRRRRLEVRRRQRIGALGAGAVLPGHDVAVPVAGGRAGDRRRPDSRHPDRFERRPAIPSR